MARKDSRVTARGRLPYAWLGAGTMTVGIGAAILAGPAAAHADAGDGGGPDRSSSSSSRHQSPDGSGPRADRPGRTALRHPGDAGGASIPRPEETTPPSHARAAAARTNPIPAPDATERSARPAAATSSAAPAPAAPRPSAAVDEVNTDPPAAVQTAAPTDPSWSMDSYLNGVKIVPGASVALARQQISGAKTTLDAGTWQSGKVLAGLASIVPQSFLSQAQWSLSKWQDSIEGDKQKVAETVGMPIVHQLAQLSLLTTLLLPAQAEAALKRASMTVPLVGVFGAPAAASEAAALIDQARQNGQVYRLLFFTMRSGYNEIGQVSVNKGPRIPVVLDTGSSGLSTTMPYVGQQGLGPSTGQGEGGYGTGPTAVYYTYDKYTTTVDFGKGAVTAPSTIAIVTAGTAQGYDNYQFPDGIVGVLGIAANRGSGPNINVSLPGELKDGVLLYQFRDWGVMVLGPNPMPVRTSVPGVPDAYVTVSINGGPKKEAKAIIDSGGINGELPASILGTGQTEGDVPVGTVISVYTRDGKTLLYSYTTTETNTPKVTTSDEFNTGNAPFQLGPIYADYSRPDGIGTTAFNYV